MKYVRLIIKFAILTLLVAIRSGELDVMPLFANLKQRHQATAEYYVHTLASLIVFLLMLDFIQFVIIGFYRRRKRMKGEDNFTIGIGHIYSILLVIGVTIGLLSLFRMEVKEVLTSLSIVFAGLALLTKDYISNMINGMIITFSGQMSIGDNVRINQHKGKIIDITLQNIHLLNDDDDVIYIPNNLTLLSEVINYTKREIKRTSIDFDIHLRHLVNIEELETIIVETLKPFHDVIKEDSYYLRVAEVRKDSVGLKFQYILKEPNKDMERVIRRKTIRRIIEIISAREKVVDELPDIENVRD